MLPSINIPQFNHCPTKKFAVVKGRMAGFSSDLPKLLPIHRKIESDLDSIVAEKWVSATFEIAERLGNFLKSRITVPPGNSKLICLCRIPARSPSRLPANFRLGKTRLAMPFGEMGGRET